MAHSIAPIKVLPQIKPIAVLGEEEEEGMEYDADGWPVWKPACAVVSEESAAEVHALLHKAVARGNHTYSIAQLVGVYPA